MAFQCKGEAERLSFLLDGEIPHAPLTEISSLAAHRSGAYFSSR